MCEDVAIKLSNVGKMYKMFSSRADNLLYTLGLAWKKECYKEFWALRGIDLTLPVGSRTGILGRNGAGKSTLLKLITGNITPTEGSIVVKGKIQALLDAGAGFHPEFSGYENIRASLTYQGLKPAQIKNVVDEIAEFAELGDFLQQPYRTYSTGMQARLAFAAATAVKPEILIVDEILGAGDAYFVGKSAERIRQLVTGGASILLVSHSLDQILKLCDRAIWIERGKIVNEGTSLEVVKAYERHIRELEEERLKAKNRTMRQTQVKELGGDRLGETLYLVFTVTAGASCDLAAMVFKRSGKEEAHLIIGDAQDVSAAHAAYVDLTGGDWSPPKHTTTNVFYRSITGRDGNTGSARIGVQCIHVYEREPYSCELTYRFKGQGSFSLELIRDGSPCGQSIVSDASSNDWRTVNVGVWHFENKSCAMTHAPDAKKSSQDPHLSRWPGEGSLSIRTVTLLNEHGNEQAIYHPDSTMALKLTFVANRAGSFTIVPVAVLYRLDGVLVTTHVGKEACLQLERGEMRDIYLNYSSINLGDGRYVFSVALYRKLSILDDAEVYDLLDRSYEFAVKGNAPLENGIVRSAATWSFQ